MELVIAAVLVIGAFLVMWAIKQAKGKGVEAEPETEPWLPQDFPHMRTGTDVVANERSREDLPSDDKHKRRGDFQI